MGGARSRFLRASVGLSAAGLAVGLALGLGARAPVVPDVHAGPEAPGPSVELAVAATAHDAEATWTELRVLGMPGGAATDRGRATLASTLGRIPHPPGAVVRGDVPCGARAVVVVADEGPRDFESALFVADEARGGRRLLGGVLHASRPLASRGGEIIVERGREGPPPSADGARRGLLRVDALTIDAVDRSTGAARTVLADAGYALHVAGELDGEIIVYRVRPEGADVVAVDLRTGALRAVADVAPFARDFSVDGRRRALVFSNRDVRDANVWLAARLDLATGAVVRLAETPGEAPAPFALPGGALAITAPGRRGLVLRASDAEGPLDRDSPRLAPRGDGFDAVVAATADGVWAALVHTAEGAPDASFGLHLASKASVALGGDERIEPLAFLGAATCGGGAR